MSSPLEGIRVIDLTSAMAGPFATMLLADLGADVVKVEPPEGDHARDWGPPFYAGKFSGYFASVNRGKRSVVVDLRYREGREVVYRLVKKSHVVVESFRPGVASRLGIDYATLSRVNPKVVYCSISGFGQSGPYRDLPGYDLIALAMSGLMDLTGEPERPPVKFGVPITDMVTGMYAVIAILSALYSGIGTYIDVSLLDSAISLLTYQASYYFITGKDPERLGSAHSAIAPYQAFRAKDGYLVVAVGNDRLWREFCKALGIPELAENPEFATNNDRVVNRVRLAQVLNEIFCRESVEYWIRRLREAGIPVAPVYRVSQALNDEHIIMRGMVRELNHPILGTIKAIANPIRYSGIEVWSTRPPPIIGEHTVEVLKELGYGDNEIEELLKSKVILQYGVHL